MIVKGVSINDIHFGIRDSKRLYEELQIVKDYLWEHDVDLLTLNGDYFDCKLSVGDPATFYAVSFFDELIKIVREKKIVLRVLQGTKSHDLNQLQIFKHYEEDISLDFRIIETAEEEELFDDQFKVVYIPEEYPENADEYYARYKTGKYNVMFAHTTFDFVAMPGQIEQSKKDTHTAPVLIWKEWKDALENGFATVGHIHGRNTYGKKIFYSGSFSRWNYGERSDKGFTYYEYDTEKLIYDVRYIDNELAPAYDVISVRELNLDLDNADVSMVQESLNVFVNGKKETDNLRIDLSGLSKEKIEILREHYKTIPNIKIEVRDDRKISLKESAAKKEEFEKYHYITKRQMPLNETIKKFCKEDLKKDIALKDIDGVLKEDG